MLRNIHCRLALCLAGAGLLAACAGPAPVSTATAVPVVQASATRPAATATSQPSSTLTAPTATAAPSSTAAATASLTPTASATATTLPASTPSATPSDTATPTRLPTRAPVTITPLGPPESQPVMSTTSGPAGYAGKIQCQRAGAACAAVMPPGDVSFSLSLASEAGAPWTHFVNYGLSVEKDGANVAGLFMFVDAGWLQPGTVVGFGASRNFSQPGVYVIRSSGCLTTDLKSNACVWATLAGDVVTFRIQ